MLIFFRVSLITYCKTMSRMSHYRFFQEMQGRYEQLQRELAAQRDQDGGVFISIQQKEDMERRTAELEQLRREYRDLSVS